MEKCELEPFVKKTERAEGRTEATTRNTAAQTVE